MQKIKRGTSACKYNDINMTQQVEQQSRFDNFSCSYPVHQSIKLNIHYHAIDTSDYQASVSLWHQVYKISTMLINANSILAQYVKKINHLMICLLNTSGTTA